MAMKFMQIKILRTCLNKRNKNGRKDTSYSVTSQVQNSMPESCDECCRWCFTASSLCEERAIPKDVPKGHVVIYVGEYHKRFVIKMSLLEHPLFKALLDQAHDVYDSKLCISCNEDLFLNVVQCAKSSQNRRGFRCF